MFASVFGNIITIIVKLHRKRLKTFNSGDLLIINLAICDLNKTWITYIVWIYTYVVVGEWKFNELFCIILQKSVVILFSVTSMTLLVLTVERFFLIVKPFNRSFTLKRTAIGLVSVWLVITVLVIVPGFTKFCVLEIGGVTICAPATNRNIWLNLYEYTYFTAFIFIPLITIFAFSSKAASRLRKSMRTCCNQVKVSRKFNEKMRRNKSAINMLRSIALGGFMCYAPWAVSYLLQTHNREILENYFTGTILQPFFAWTIFGGFCNAPMTYFFFSKEFRKETMRVFRTKRKSTPGTTTRIAPK